MRFTSDIRVIYTSQNEIWLVLIGTPTIKKNTIHFSAPQAKFFEKQGSRTRFPCSESRVLRGIPAYFRTGIHPIPAYFPKEFPEIRLFP